VGGEGGKEAENRGKEKEKEKSFEEAIPHAGKDSRAHSRDLC